MQSIWKGSALAQLFSKEPARRDPESLVLRGPINGN